MKKTLTIGLILSAALVLAGCATPTTSTHAPTIDSEESFLVNMLSHHQEAIESADIVWGKSTNVEVRKLAEGIVKTQEKEVNNMQDWLANWYSGSTMKIDYMDMMPAISELNTPELDRTFLEGMIDHHKWAIKMAKEVLRRKPRAEIITLANNVITTQTEEIATMQQLLRDMK